MIPKNETTEKLKRVAEALFTKWGLEVITFDNFKTLCQNTGSKLNVRLSEKTYRNHLKTIADMIKNLQFEKSLEGLSNVFDNDEVDEIFSDLAKEAKANMPIQPIELLAASNDEISAIKVMFKSGKEQMFYPEVIEAPKPQAPKEKEYTGLFNYRTNGAIIIRRGTYQGVNIKSKTERKEKFGSMSWFYKWCVRKIEEAKLGKIHITPDTPRDVETLKKIVKRIETSMDY